MLPPVTCHLLFWVSIRNYYMVLCPWLRYPPIMGAYPVNISKWSPKSDVSSSWRWNRGVGISQHNECWLHLLQFSINENNTSPMFLRNLNVCSCWFLTQRQHVLGGSDGEVWHSVAANATDATYLVWESLLDGRNCNATQWYWGSNEGRQGWCIFLLELKNPSILKITG